MTERKTERKRERRNNNKDSWAVFVFLLSYLMKLFSARYSTVYVVQPVTCCIIWIQILKIVPIWIQITQNITEYRFHLEPDTQQRSGHLNCHHSAFILMHSLATLLMHICVYSCTHLRLHSCPFAFIHALT